MGYIRNVSNKISAKILQKSGESKSRKLNNMSKNLLSLSRGISKRNKNRIKTDQLNINSIKNKFDPLDPAVVRNRHML